MPLGAIIGPLVLCGFLVEEEESDLLKKIGVKDSKQLSPRRRSFLYQKLKKTGHAKIIKLSASDIDRLRTEQNLNKIEISHMQQIVNALKPDIVFVDSVESNTEKFCHKLLAKIDDKEKYEYGNNFICENRADVNYPVVGAASIIAKVVRDAEVSKLHKYGYFGSGYPSDPRTMEFLKKWLSEKGSMPSFARSSWIPAKQLKKDHEQKRLGEFA
ncbi:MAG: ribonuclease HII [Candidatus Aenigmarchaeota archaeon]|nr:ribonuclease HII [Candidatus Aenigmarchaeota archaeon]